MNKLFLSAMAALGLLLASDLTSAQNPPRPPTAPTPPTPPTPPRPPKGITVKIHDGQVQIAGVADLIDAQINRALEALDHDQQIPPEAREKLRRHLEKVRDKTKKRILKIKVTDMDQLGEELGRMGDEIGSEMEDFGKEMEKWGKDFEKKMGKNFEKEFAKQWKQHADDNDNDLPAAADVDEQDDLDDAMRDLGSLNLSQQQRAKLKQLREDSQRKVDAAKRDLERASEQLQKQLENPSVSEQDISRSIDNVTKLEADIRKARILAWVKARGELQPQQRQKVEGVVKTKRK
jgi:hypothetical protein